MTLRWLAFAGPADLPAADPADTKNFLAWLIETGQPILMLDDGAGPVGSVSAIVTPYLLNRSVLMAQGLSLWIDPAYRRGRGADMLLEAMDAELIRRGVRRTTIAAREPVRGAAVERRLRARGYRLVERLLAKDLPHGT